jgi:hypothetical protein
MKKPEVRIKFSWLLYETVSENLDKLWASENNKIASKEQCEEWAESYRLEWAKYEAKIFPAICGVLKLEFYKPVIDVTLAPWVSPISDPAILSFQYEPDQFIDALTHELIHILLTDNNKFTFFVKDGIKLDKEWEKLFGAEHTFTTLVHIPVNAVLKYIYLDILNEPRRLERDIEVNKQSPDYDKAWNFVETNDYIQIIEQAKDIYGK